MNEIPGNEIRETRNSETEGYRKIKPEKETSTREVDDYWDAEFKNGAEKAQAESHEKAEREYFDDNGTKYREGDKLLPNTKFEVNGHQYETDEMGRTISAEGQLKLCNPEEYTRHTEEVRNFDGQEYKEGDDRGHLIGHRFGGSDKLENLVPMDSKLNQGDFKKLENSLASALENDTKVYLKVEPVYEGNSARPSEFRVSYSVDGEMDVVVFKNESGVKNDK